MAYVDKALRAGGSKALPIEAKVALRAGAANATWTNARAPPMSLQPAGRALCLMRWPRWRGRLEQTMHALRALSPRILPTMSLHPLARASRRTTTT